MPNDSIRSLLFDKATTYPVAEFAFEVPLSSVRNIPDSYFKSYRIGNRRC
jgi:hypothetical protein